MVKSKEKNKIEKIKVKSDMKKPTENKVNTGRQKMVGRVVSAKTTKTAVVLVERTKIHPLYGKAFKRSKKYLVHDEKGVSEGDVVEIMQTKPISKNKHFIINKVVGKDIEAIVAEQLKEEAAEEIAEVMPEEKEEEPSDISHQTEEEEKENKKTKKGKGESDS